MPTHSLGSTASLSLPKMDSLCHNWRCTSQVIQDYQLLKFNVWRCRGSESGFGVKRESKTFLHFFNADIICREQCIEKIEYENNDKLWQPMSNHYEKESRNCSQWTLKVHLNQSTVAQLGAPWSGSRSIAYLRRTMYIKGTPGIFRILLLSSLSHVATI